MRAVKAKQDFKAALDELAVVLADYIDEPEKVSVPTRKRQRATIPSRETIAI